MPSRQIFLSVFPRDMIAPGGRLCSQTIREAKGMRIKTFQSGLFRPAIPHPPLSFLPGWHSLRSFGGIGKTQRKRNLKRRVVPEKWRAGNWDLPPLILRTRSVLIGSESREKTARTIRIQIARRKGLHLVSGCSRHDCRLRYHSRLRAFHESFK